MISGKKGGGPLIRACSLIRSNTLLGCPSDVSDTDSASVFCDVTDSNVRLLILTSVNLRMNVRCQQ